MEYRDHIKRKSRFKMIFWVKVVYLFRNNKISHTYCWKRWKSTTIKLTTKTNKRVKALFLVLYWDQPWRCGDVMLRNKLCSKIINDAAVWRSWRTADVRSLLFLFYHKSLATTTKKWHRTFTWLKLRPWKQSVSGLTFIVVAINTLQLHFCHNESPACESRIQKHCGTNLTDWMKWSVM